jgi:hypothetical protein
VEFFGDEARRAPGFGGLPAHPHPDQVRASYRSAHEAAFIRGIVRSLGFGFWNGNKNIFLRIFFGYKIWSL